MSNTAPTTPHRHVARDSATASRVNPLAAHYEAAWLACAAQSNLSIR